MRIATPVLAAALAMLAALPMPALSQGKSCADCGVVQSMRYVEEKGQASGVGAVAGGVVGGVIGHQIGSGRGNDAATAAGAIGGAVAGHEIEKRRSGDEDYRITVEFRDGRRSSFVQDSLDGLRVGDRIRVADGRLYRD
jgi:outer membrane lipoprotein SlyB